jgi:hypothetical protein
MRSLWQFKTASGLDLFNILYFQRDRRLQNVQNPFDLGFSFVDATKEYVTIQRLKHEEEAFEGGECPLRFEPSKWSILNV